MTASVSDSAFDDLLPDSGRFTRTTSSLSLEVDAASWPTDALYAAAFTFIDRCYVLLDVPAEGRARMHLAAKSGVLEAGAARALAEELAAELCGHAWRGRVIEENRLILEAVTVDAYDGGLEAFFRALDDPGGGLVFDDPLGISLSWEEKFGDKKRAAGAGTPDAKPAGDPSGDAGS
jgi:hypothetical protein